jgi:G3E family GTPase
MHEELLLISGFLGSGKTTLVVALARELAARGKKTSFVVNEVGEIGVDQQVMRDGGLEVFEITAGCICCQVGIDLVKTLEVLSENYRSDMVIVEAAGVATPNGVSEALEYYKGVPFRRVVSAGVLDPTRLDMLLEVVTPLIESQISQVDEIVISKLDEATEAQVHRAVEEAARLNSKAPRFCVSAIDTASVGAWVETHTGGREAGK